MNTSIQPFFFDGNEVRTVMQDGEPWFVAKDVCTILDLTNPTMAVQLLDDDERAKYYLGRQGETNIISESGLYALVFKSRKKEAKAFRKWVTSEVLPAIRKQGFYAMPNKTVEVRHSHLRKTSAPGELDARYDVDLSKLMIKVLDRPTSVGMEMLEIITGLNFTSIDISGDGNRPSDRDYFFDFFVECCEQVENESTSASLLYECFVDWYRKNVDKNESRTPSQRRFGMEFKRLFPSKRTSDGIFYIGVQLKEVA